MRLCTQAILRNHAFAERTEYMIPRSAFLKIGFKRITVNPIGFAETFFMNFSVKQLIASFDRLRRLSGRRNIYDTTAASERQQKAKEE